MAEPLPRTASSQAMQSLFSAYDEDEAMEEDADATADKISGSEDEAMDHPSPPPVLKEISPRPSPQPKMERKVTKLVSYMADDVNEGEEEDSDEPSDEEETEEGDKKAPFSLVDYNMSLTATDLDTSAVRDTSAATTTMSASDDDVHLPPEPTGRCPKHLQQKIAGYYEKMLRTGLNLSRSIEHRKDFRNPSIYEKLIHFVDIDEKGTNYPPHLYDPAIWGQESYYDNLAKFQKEEMDKREKEKKEKTKSKIEFVVGTKKADGSDHKYRKSKWDAQPQGTVAAKPPPPISAAGVATNPSLVTVTSAPSGTKTTVISAVGTLKKTSAK